MNTRLEEDSDSNASDDNSNFDMSDSSDRKGGRGREDQAFKNQPYDEAVDLSNGSNESDEDEDEDSRNEGKENSDSNARTNILKNQKYDEALECSPARSKDSPDRSPQRRPSYNESKGLDDDDDDDHQGSENESVDSNVSRPIANQPFDEVFDVSEEEDDGNGGQDDDLDNASIDTKQGKSFENSIMSSSMSGKTNKNKGKGVKEEEDRDGLRRPVPDDEEGDKFRESDEEDDEYNHVGSKYDNNNSNKMKDGSYTIDTSSGNNRDNKGSSSNGDIGGISGASAGNKLQEDSDNDSDKSDGDDEESEAPTKLKGGYNSKDYAYLQGQVSNEVSELFESIDRYKAHDIELESTLKCFIPEYIPAIGEMDAFLKMGRPDGKGDDLGLRAIDEPSATQSDSTVLELQLRAISKRQAAGDVAVRSIENAAKNPSEINKWITSINELHRSKPPPQVHYRKSMPDIEQLMDVWPEEFEEALNKMALPHVDLDMPLEEYAKIICALVDIPVYEGALVESLHVLFTLYLEFKNNQHFMAVGGKVDEMGGLGGTSTPMIDSLIPPSN